MCRKFIDGKKEISEIVYHTSKDKQEKIDETDVEILKILANNGRINVVDIAGKLKKTPRIVQYRINDLEKRKIILSYKAHISPQEIGNIFCKEIIYFSNTTKEELDKFMKYASSINGAIWPQRVIGEWDFELDFELESYEKFQEIILELNEKFPNEIKDHDFCIVSKEFKLDLFPGAYKELK